MRESKFERLFREHPLFQHESKRTKKIGLTSSSGVSERLLREHPLFQRESKRKKIGLTSGRGVSCISSRLGNKVMVPTMNTARTNTNIINTNNNAKKHCYPFIPRTATTSDRREVRNEELGRTAAVTPNTNTTTNHTLAHRSINRNFRLIEDFDDFEMDDLDNPDVATPWKPKNFRDDAIDYKAAAYRDIDKRTTDRNSNSNRKSKQQQQQQHQKQTNHKFNRPQEPRTGETHPSTQRQQHRQLQQPSKPPRIHRWSDDGYWKFEETTPMRTTNPHSNVTNTNSTPHYDPRTREWVTSLKPEFYPKENKPREPVYHRWKKGERVAVQPPNSTEFSDFADIIGLNDDGTYNLQDIFWGCYKKNVPADRILCYEDICQKKAEQPAKAGASGRAVKKKSRCNSGNNDNDNDNDIGRDDRGGTIHNSENDRNDARGRYGNGGACMVNKIKSEHTTDFRDNEDSGVSEKKTSDKRSSKDHGKDEDSEISGKDTSDSNRNRTHDEDDNSEKSHKSKNEMDSSKNSFEGEDSGKSENRAIDKYSSNNRGKNEDRENMGWTRVIEESIVIIH